MASTRRKRILVVEDSEDVARVLVAILTSDGHEVELASTGAEAIARVSSFAADAAIVDLRLPDRRGDDVAVELRSQLPRVRLVGLTGDGLSRLTTQQRERFDTVLPKPFRLEDLLEAL